MVTIRDDAGTYIRHICEDHLVSSRMTAFQGVHSHVMKTFAVEKKTWPRN